MVPEHLWRFATGSSQQALARRFGLPCDLTMQDWACEAADGERIDEFVAAYRKEKLSDDERFTLMELILHSLDELGEGASDHPQRETIADLLSANFRLHAYSIWYWSRPEQRDPREDWAITPIVRPILERHRAELTTLR